MSSESKVLGDAIVVISRIAEGGVVGVLELTVALAKKGILDAEDVKSIADAVTRKIPEENLSSPHAIFRALLPGYEPSEPQPL